ncbi:uncharacterized protein LAJ45_07427 [Morchella importuna]|uniref:uncharacterized protein n=1 Tax=Morchella importuna TaxID=1174673 RepID=UPI001E8E8F0F|nr:uncharacterized protein LAJ45_07427 [Morchella importuna]KAH8148326.1 hypothetical protein LAJ45_07427 [Morchella importuna]
MYGWMDVVKVPFSIVFMKIPEEEPLRLERPESKTPPLITSASTFIFSLMCQSVLALRESNSIRQHCKYGCHGRKSPTSLTM